MHLPRTGLLALLLALAAAAASAADFAAIAEQAKAAFEPVSEADVEAARERLAERVVAVERHLDPATEFGAGWLDYLSWDGVQQQVTPGAEVDLRAARRTLAALGSGAEGLESPVFRRAAEALRDYVGLAAFASAADQAKVFQAQADLLTRVLEERSLDDPRMSFEAERRLALFEGAGVGEPLTAAVREEYGAPNVLLEVDESLLGRLVDRMVSECKPVEDCILGTRIRGTGYTTGQLAVSTLAAPDRARLVFSLAGSTRSSTRGVNGPVAIYSTGQTAFTAHKAVELRDERFLLLPSSASASTRTKTNRVERIGGGLFSGLIERIASDRVAENKPRADAIAADHAEDRIRRDLDDQLTERIRDARRAYDDRFTKPLRRRGAAPRRVAQRTTDDKLFLEAVQAGPGQLAAPGAPPEAAAGDVVARIHQSAANNLLAAYLGGATLRRDSQDEPARLVGRVTPEWLVPDDDEPTPAPREDVDFEPYRLRFRTGRPVSFAIDGGELRVVVHAARISVEAENYDDWDLILVFRPEESDGRIKLVRQGEVEVLPTGFDPDSGERLPSRQVALRGNLAKALNDPADRLPQEIRLDPIDLDPEASIDLLSLEQLRLEDGWAVSSWAAE